MRERARLETMKRGRRREMLDSEAGLAARRKKETFGGEGELTMRNCVTAFCHQEIQEIRVLIHFAPKRQQLGSGDVRAM